MKAQNITYKNGVPFTKSGNVVPIDNSFNVIQAHTLGSFGPDVDLTSQNAVNDFLIAVLGKIANVPLSFTAHPQFYTSTVQDLGVYAPYLPNKFVIRTSSSNGNSSVSQELANLMALADAQTQAVALIALNAHLASPNSSGLGSFTGVNSQLLY